MAFTTSGEVAVALSGIQRGTVPAVTAHRLIAGKYCSFAIGQVIFAGSATTGVLSAESDGGIQLAVEESYDVCFPSDVFGQKAYCDGEFVRSRIMRVFGVDPSTSTKRHWLMPSAPIHFTTGVDVPGIPIAWKASRNWRVRTTRLATKTKTMTLRYSTVFVFSFIARSIWSAVYLRFLRLALRFLRVALRPLRAAAVLRFARRVERRPGILYFLRRFLRRPPMKSDIPPVVGSVTVFLAGAFAVAETVGARAASLFAAADAGLDAGVTAGGGTGAPACPSVLAPSPKSSSQPPSYFLPRYFLVIRLVLRRGRRAPPDGRIFFISRGFSTGGG